MASEILGVSEAAKEYGLSVDAIGRALRSEPPQIEGAKLIGKTYIFTRTSFERWLSSRRRPGRQPGFSPRKDGRRPKAVSALA